MPISSSLSFEVQRLNQTEQIAVKIHRLVIAGWTGRDQAAVQHHIDELAERGVKAPATTPVFYRASAARLSQASALDVPGKGNSGEVEFVLFQHGGELFVTLGSDHTDNDVEAYSVTAAKQMCDKPVATIAWVFEDVRAHWDEITMRAWAWEDGKKVLYQEGKVAAMLQPAVLMQGLSELEVPFDDGTLMFNGTFDAIGGMRFADRLEVEMEDPALGRKISLGYDIRTIPSRG